MGHCLWIGGDATNPNKWDVAANWSPAAVPTNNDLVTIPAGAPSITDGLSQSGVTLDGFVIEEGFDEQIGTETDDLEITLASDDLVLAAGSNSVVYLHVGVSGISDVSPFVGSCGAGASGVYGLQLCGEHYKQIHFGGAGKLGVGTRPGDTDTEMDEINVTGAGTAVLGPDVTDMAGTGAPDVTVTHASAVVTALCDTATVEALAGVFRQAFGHWTTANVHEATVYASGDGIHSTTRVDGRGKLYNNENLGAREFTNVTIEDGGTWIDSAGKGSYANPVEFPTGMGRCTLDFGRNKELTIASI